VPASANCNIEMTFCSENCGGQGENKFIIAAFIYAVKNVQIHSVTHKYLVLCQTYNECGSFHSVIGKNITRTLKSGPVLFCHSVLQLLELQGRTEDGRLGSRSRD
jgi:hypothetical protein